QIPELTVFKGQMVAVVGESGCGKSTLLDLIALVMEPTEIDRFEIDLGPDGPRHDLARLWHEHNEAAMAALRRDHFGYVLQTGGLLPFLSVRRNITLPRAIKGLPDGGQELVALAERVGLAGYLDRSPDALSIGQRQRAAILRAIFHRPRLVLADEPTAAVDKARARTIMADLQQLARADDVAVMIVTHDVDLVAGACDSAYTFEITPNGPGMTRSICRSILPGALQ
ncbi:MAG: ATP-binding cassette domain-containing protein, partial [Wenzhouxiangellaceae bacterium]